MNDFKNFLDFEKPVVELEEKLLGLRQQVEQGELSAVTNVEKLQKRLDKVRKDVYGNLSPHQRVRLSRHLERPFTSDYIKVFIDDFVELHGDRLFGDDSALVGGLGKFAGKSVVVVGHERGRSTQERVKRNFGMTQPEGNRKAQRLFKLAEKFSLPLILFIDTQGAYPGLEAEARGQAEAIAKNLFLLAGLKTPIVSVVIGEGGSGGALALGICDRLIMLENSTYSVITPEGCASIIWGKTDPDNVPEHAKTAAEALRLTAPALKDLGVVDELLQEPAGGAHRYRAEMAQILGGAIAKQLQDLEGLSQEELLEKRYEKFRIMGSLAE